jgi:hypothetical protein
VKRLIRRSEYQGARLQRSLAKGGQDIRITGYQEKADYAGNFGVAKKCSLGRIIYNKKKRYYSRLKMVCPYVSLIYYRTVFSGKS